MDSEQSLFQSGFIALVGPTNSGKSTLMNALVGEKVSIVSRRVQTTYHGIRGIVGDKDFQLVLVDTPGYQNRKESLARMLNRVAETHATDCDFQAWIFDASQKNCLSIIESLEERVTNKKPENNICVLNKIDLVGKTRLLPLMESIHKKGWFKEIIPVSAKTRCGLDILRNIFKARLSQGEKFYPGEEKTDRTLDFRITELVREKIYELCYEEIPYSVRILVEPPPGNLPTPKTPTFYVSILVPTPTKRAILIGKGGVKLKGIGTQARIDIEQITGHQICLKLHVRVDEDWRANPKLLRGYLELV